MKNINHKDSFFLSRKAPTFASGNSNPRIRGMRFLQRKEAKQLVNINYYNGSKKAKQTNRYPVSCLFCGQEGRHYCHTHWCMPCANLLQLPPLTEWISSGLDYKVATTIMQIFGYLISKFFAIKIVSELKRENRLKFMIFSVALAELALVFFGLLPQPFNVFALFFNGLALGCMWESSSVS